MVARFQIVPVPDFVRDPIGAKRVVDQNFHALADLLNRAIAAGTIVGAGTITEAMLALATKTLVGDVTGTVGASGSTTVEKIRNRAIPAPVAANDQQEVYYDHATLQFKYRSASDNILSIRSMLPPIGILDVRAGSGVTVLRDAGGFIVSATASSYPGASDADLQNAGRVFRTPTPIPDVRAGTNVTVVRDAAGFIVSASSGSTPNDADLQNAVRSFDTPASVFVHGDVTGFLPKLSVRWDSDQNILAHRVFGD